MSRVTDVDSAPPPVGSAGQVVLHRNTVAVQNAASALGLELEFREFPEGTRTAKDAARAIGVDVGQIVKSLVFAVGTTPNSPDGRVVMAIVSGTNQLDERKLAAAARTPTAWRVDADAVRLATGFPVGGVSPLGHPAPLLAWIDEDLLAYDVVWAAAGTPEVVFAISPTALKAATSAITASLAKRAVAS